MTFCSFFKSNKYYSLAIFFIVLFSYQATFPQDAKLSVKVISETRISINGEFSDQKSSFKNWTFLQNYADVTNLAEKIEKFQLFDEKGNAIEVRKLMSGEYLAAKEPKSWAYQVDLTPSAKLTDSAHSSWLTETHGLLMLEDLLPQIKKPLEDIKIVVEFILPDDFEIFSTFPWTMSGKIESPILHKNIFLVSDVDTAVFLVGKNLRSKTFSIHNEFGLGEFNFITNAEWKFSDDEALQQIQAIFNEYHKTIGSLPNWKTNIIILPFPQENTNPDRWRAETRGSTVTIISGQLPHKSQAIQRLNEQLRHELFHLWMPNNLALSGNYDWFYEGFTVYHALRTGVELNQIRFNDFLNTISQAYRISDFLITESGQNLSLIEASNNRWAGLSNVIYAKGLVVAFLCDVALLQKSKGKRNLKDVFRQVYQKYQIGQSKPVHLKDGNTAILEILKSFPELDLVAKNYIEGKSKIEWQNDLAMVGLTLEGRQLKVVEAPNGRQKDLLDKLGYNHWRKLLQKTK